ncbi:unnamed protein product [Ilex paraguariensis]|uniref:Uncharacterized protein n=1 Tax=Ilex paraguariensis TaxID=185542 RepID=A0ABC8UI19_9AQUA
MVETQVVFTGASISTIPQNLHIRDTPQWKVLHYTYEVEGDDVLPEDPIPLFVEGPSSSTALPTTWTSIDTSQSISSSPSSTQADPRPSTSTAPTPDYMSELLAAISGLSTIWISSSVFTHKRLDAINSRVTSIEQGQEKSVGTIGGQMTCPQAMVSSYPFHLRLI